MKKKVEFKPPSDFVADDSGGGSNNVWKYIGIGCGVVLLIVGVAFAFGAWKTASCCGDVVDAGKYSVAAGEMGSTFASNVSQGNVDSAYSNTSDAFQERVSKEAFRERLAEHADLLQSSAPRQSGMTTDSQQGKQEPNLKPKDWTISYEFAGPNAKQKLVMTLNVVRKGEGEDATFAVDTMSFKKRERVLSAEPPAETVVDFHRKARRGSYDLAYNLMAQEYSTNNDRSAFDSFLDENQAVYLGSDPTIISVDYGAGATVVAQTRGEKGGTWNISYSLTRGFSASGWTIKSITPKQVEAPEGADGATEEGSDESGANAGEEGADGSEAKDEADESGESGASEKGEQESEKATE